MRIERKYSIRRKKVIGDCLLVITDFCQVLKDVERKVREEKNHKKGNKSAKKAFLLIFNRLFRGLVYANMT
jgi:hypothetical protein